MNKWHIRCLKCYGGKKKKKMLTESSKAEAGQPSHCWCRTGMFVKSEMFLLTWEWWAQPNHVKNTIRGNKLLKQQKPGHTSQGGTVLKKQETKWENSTDSMLNTWCQQPNLKWTLLLFGLYLHLITLRAFQQFAPAFTPNATVGLKPGASPMSSRRRWSKRVSLGSGLVQICLHSPGEPGAEAEQTAHCVQNPMLYMTKS